MPTNFLAKFAKLADPTFIKHTGILKPSAGLQVGMRGVGVTTDKMLGKVWGITHYQFSHPQCNHQSVTGTIR